GAWRTLAGTALRQRRHREPARHKGRSTQRDGRSQMNGKAWRVAAVSLLTGFMIGMPGAARAADGQDDDPALAALFEGAPAHPDQLFRVEWVASPGPSGHSRLEGSVHNDFGRTALNV